MKKAALFLGIIFALGTCVVSWKLLHSGPMSPAELVPINAIALIEIPDVPSAIEHWKNSELSKLTSEPEIQAFFNRPRDYFFQKSGLSANGITPKTVTDLFAKIKPGRFFASLVPSQKEIMGGWIIGCQFFGNKTSLEESLNRLADTLEGALGTSNDVLLKPEEHHGEVIKKRIYLSSVLFISMHGNWCFVSNDLEALQKTLDLNAGRTLKKEALTSSSLYEQNRHRLFSEGDLLCYIAQNKMLETLPLFSSLLQENPLMKLARASGASFRFIEEGMEERLFFNGNLKIKEEIDHRGVHFTQPTTLGFIERVSEWKYLADQITNNPALPPHFASFLATSGLDLRSLAALLKPEMTFVIDWARASVLPSILLTAPEADSEKMANWLDQTATQLGTSVEASDQNDLLMISMPKIASTIQPTFASANGSFFASTDPSLVKQSSTRNAAAPTLEAAPYFAKNASLYHDANEAFFYFASKEIFERAYELGRPSLLMGSAFFPQARMIIDFSRLPTAATVAKHLTPIIIAQSHEQDGFLIQSRGPLSATPLFLLGKTLFKTFFLKQQTASAATLQAPEEQ